MDSGRSDENFNVLLDARPLNGTRNGIGRYVEQLVREWPNVTAMNLTLISNRPIVTAVPLPSSIKIVVDGGIWRKIPGTFWLLLRAPGLARELKATHVLGTQHIVPVLGMANTIKGVVIHDIVFNKFPETMQWTNRTIGKLLIPWSVRKADRVFCVSDTTRSDLVAAYAPAQAKIDVAYPGCTFDNAEPFVPGNTSTRKLLAVGSIEPRKNIDKLLRAFLIMRKTSDDVTLDIVTGNAWGPALSDEMKAAILADKNINIHKNISDSALNDLYRAADILVFPSIYEGFGLPILEAIGKCAIIANDIPVFRELDRFIDGISFVDFGGTDATAAQQLLAKTAHTAPARFRDAANSEIFSWRRCAEIISTKLSAAGKK